MMQFYSVDNLNFFETCDSNTLEYNIEVSKNIVNLYGLEDEVLIATIPNIRTIDIAKMSDDEYETFLKTNNLFETVF